jgi:hypothetical protein
MDFEFETTRTGLANAFAAAGAELLAYQPLVSTAVAPIPDTQPQKYAVAGTLPGILQMAGKMMGEDAVEKPTGDLTDEQIESSAKAIYNLLPPCQGVSAKDYPWQPGGNSMKQDEARRYARAAIAAHLARQPKAEQPVTAVPPADVIAATIAKLKPDVPDDVTIGPDGALFRRGYRAAIADVLAILDKQAAPTALTEAGSVADVDSVDTVEFGNLLGKVCDASNAECSTEEEWREAYAALIDHIHDWADHARRATLAAYLARQAQAEPVYSLPEAGLWMTMESRSRLAAGGNGKGAVPVHGKRSATATIPLYTAEQMREALRASVAPAGVPTDDEVFAAHNIGFAAGLEKGRREGAQNAEAIRNQALEEAAKACVEIGNDWLDVGDVNKEYAAEYLAKHIRSLKGQPCAQNAPDDVREAVARAIWNIRRDEEDRCDMELEDMAEDHPVWAEADAAIRALQTGSANTQEGGAA